MIKLSKKKLIVVEELDDIEKKVFVKFLEVEKDRHQDDIDMIDETIKHIENEKKV